MKSHMALLAWLSSEVLPQDASTASDTYTL
jgi:hypothetical protein